MIHRDLKPSNVLLAPDGPRVIDFGISVAAETSPLTRTGLLIGSPGYMSPEQVEGREVGPASDMFSLGAVLAFAATGEAPFGNGSAPTLAYRAVYRQVNLDRVPAEVRGLIDRCLTKDPGQRPTARDLMFAAGAGAIPPTERWVPTPLTRTFTELPAAPGGSRTVTSARLSPVSQPAPGRPGRHQGRRQRRPLAIASVVVGILAASAAGGIAVAGCTPQTVGVHSVSSSISSAPATSAPSTSPTAIVAPSTSASATASATPTATATPTAITTGTPTASPTATGTPTATATATPTAITTGTPTATATATGTTTPAP